MLQVDDVNHARDIQAFKYEQAKQEPITFHELEQFDQWRNVMNQQQKYADDTQEADMIQKYDVVVINAGTMIGTDLHLTALSIANEIIANQKESSNMRSTTLRVIIIKSKIFSNLARRIVRSQRLFDGSITFPHPCDIPWTSAHYIIASIGVNEYRRTIPFIAKPGDEIIEVGCHFGQTTTLLHEAATTHTERRVLYWSGYWAKDYQTCNKNTPMYLL